MTAHERQAVFETVMEAFLAWRGGLAPHCSFEFLLRQALFEDQVDVDQTRRVTEEIHPAGD